MRRNGSATRSIGRRDSESSPASSNRPACPARTPTSSRMSVAAFPQSIGASGAASPRRPTPCTVSVSTSCSSTRTPSARTAAIVDSVSAERPNPNPRFALADRTDEERSVRDRLVARNGDVPDEGGHRLDSHGSSERRAQRPLRLQKLGGAAASRSPATKRVSVPPRSGERCLSSKSSRLIRSAERACVIPASTPGRSGTWTRIRWREPGSGYACSSILRRLRAASPTQRARKPASPAASARSSCSIRRRAQASASDMGWEF